LFDYTTWITEQATKVEDALRERGRKGMPAGSAYLFRSNGAQQGFIVVAEEQPQGCHSVLRLGPHGTRLSTVPYSHIRSLLWNACRREPIIPTE